MMNFAHTGDVAARILPAAAPPVIFISVGHNLEPAQERFVQFVEQSVLATGFQVVTIGRTTQVELADPLGAIRTVIAAARGTIVIAFARLAVQRAIEYPSVKQPQPVTGRVLPTVWNQIEAAMTIQAGHPLLILSQDGLYFEGIIDPVLSSVTPFVLEQEAQSLPAAVQHAMLTWMQALR